MAPTSSRPTAAAPLMAAPLMAVLAALLLLSISGPGAAAQTMEQRMARAPDEPVRQAAVTPLSTSSARFEFTNKVFRPGFGGRVTDLWMNADSATGPLLANATGFVGFKMTVKNTGSVTLAQYTVANNALNFRQTINTPLAAGRSRSFSIQRPWARGQQSNTATLSGVKVGRTTLRTTINDRAFYFGAQPRLRIDPFVKNDAGEYVSAAFPTDLANLVTLTDTQHASGVSYKYVVTNNGNVPLSNVVLAPGTGVTAVGSTRASSLAVGKTLTVLASAPWAEGQVIKTPSATASFTPSSGQVVRPSTSKRAVYLGVVSEAVDPTPTVNVTISKHVYIVGEAEQSSGNVLASALEDPATVPVSFLIQNNENRPISVTVTISVNGEADPAPRTYVIPEEGEQSDTYGVPFAAGLVTSTITVVATDEAGNSGAPQTSTVSFTGIDDTIST